MTENQRINGSVPAPSKAGKEKNLAFLKQKQLEVEFRLDDTPYQPVQNIGTGAYGVVCSAVDSRSGKRVAIKKIPNAFAAATLIKRTLREVRILKHFRHENIVAILDMFQANGVFGHDVYMVMDLMETDLHQIIYSKQSLSEQHLQYFLYQIMRGLKYIHSAGVIHRDLKPSNLLVNADCLLKIGDFGMARSLGQCPEGQAPLMTQYVATRWYRAPELLFSMLDYTTAVDIWSVGCIFAEMIMRRQLFPGTDHMNQLKMIVYYLGTPSAQVMEKISSDLIKRIICSLGHREALTWQAILPQATPVALDLITKLMYLEPWSRLTASQTLEHPYLDSFHDPETEPVCSKQVVLETDSVENLTPDQLKKALDDTVGNFVSSKSPMNSESPKNTRPEYESPPIPPCDDSNSVEEDNDDDADIIMLSAKLEEAVISDSISSRGNGNDSEEQPKPMESQTEICNATQPDAKTALRQALQAKKAAKLGAPTTAATGTGTEQRTASPVMGGDGSKLAAQTTAHARHLERLEKRKKRSEKQAEKEKERNQQPAGGVEPPLTEQDQTLLFRWSEMQQRTEQQRLEGQIGDIILRTLPTPLATENGGFSSPNSQGMGMHDNHFEINSAGRTPRQPLDSAQLMDAWLEVTNMDPEELQDLEREIAMSGMAHMTP